MTYLAIVTVVASALMTTSGLVLIALTPRVDVPPGLQLEEALVYQVLQVALSGVGGLLAWRRPDNFIGWLLSFAGLSTAIETLTAGYAVYGLPSGALPDAPTVAWLYSWSVMAISFFVCPVIVLFPDGRIRTWAGRAAIACFLVGLALVTPMIALRPGPVMRYPTVTNPVAWIGGDGALTAMLAAGTALAAAGVILAAKSLIDRARQATPIERQQLKWFVWSCVLFALTTAAIYPSLSSGTSDSATVHVDNVLAALATATIPISIGIAILRYRLYDIDLLVKRTVVYGATSAAIAATFFLGIVVLQAILRPITSGSEVAVAASTLVSFALFQPIRRRMQSAVDRRFDRARYDAGHTLEAFADDLRDEVDLDALRSELLGAVARTMAPAHASLWLRERTR